LRISLFVGLQRREIWLYTPQIRLARAIDWVWCMGKERQCPVTCKTDLAICTKKKDVEVTVQVQVRVRVRVEIEVEIADIISRHQ
jgi:hypothetical protein